MKNSMDPFAILKEDHKKVATLMKQIADTDEEEEDAEERKELFGELRMALMDHAKMEEEILYPAMKELESMRDDAMESGEEHRNMKMMLGELSLLFKDSEKWTAKFTVLKEQVEHHVEEEENEVFPQLEKELSETQCESLTRDFLEWKEKHT